MSKVLVVNYSEREITRLRQLLEAEGIRVEFCQDGKSATSAITSSIDGYAAAFVLWDLTTPPFGFELAQQCRQRWPQMPFFAMFDELTMKLAKPALEQGATDVLQMPLDDDERLRSCLKLVRAEPQTDSPKLNALRARIIGDAPGLIEQLRLAVKMIDSDLTVLILSEPGTGKEPLARALHELSHRASEPFVPINVAAIQETLIESTLFGHEKGSFSGAQDRKIGYFETVGKGTLFLDEIGELSLTAQPKFLRVLQEKVFSRIGSTVPLRFEGRLICATNRQLSKAVKEGNYRSDLFDRLNQLQINLPPLRERTGDVLTLVNHFLNMYSKGKKMRLAQETIGLLRSYHWPGNVRELESVIQHALLVCDGELILPVHLPLRTMSTNESTELTNYHDILPRNLLSELYSAWPDILSKPSYKEAVRSYILVFDRFYLPSLWARYSPNVTQAAKATGWTAKTFRRRWNEAGLPSLREKDD